MKKMMMEMAREAKAKRDFRKVMEVACVRKVWCVCESGRLIRNTAARVSEFVSVRDDWLGRRSVWRTCFGRVLGVNLMKR